MSGTTTMAQYLERLCAMQEECVSGSKAYPGTSITSDEPVYWTNHIAGLTGRLQDPGMSSHILTIEALLVRAPLTAGIALEIEALCQADLLVVEDYFLDHPSLTTEAAPGNVELRDMIPRSLTISSQGLISVQRGDTNYWASGYTITFGFNRWRTPVRR
jgi:hypothetical protein